jgi:DNA repair exonuclease SbcCD nuclease subunit
VHVAEIISRNPWIVYPGNLQGRNARETGAKGAVRVTVEDSRIVDVTSLVLDAARWEHLSLDVSDDVTEADMFDRIKTALEAAHVGSGGRPLAARITLTGTTPLHNKIIAQQDDLLDDLRAAGFQAASDCWVERIIINTSAPSSLHRAWDTESIDVEDLLSAAAADQQFAAALPDLVKAIADKMPKDLRDEFARSEAVQTLAADARALLLGRLS